MKDFLVVVTIVMHFICALSTDYGAPPPTYEANSFTSWAKELVLDKAGSGAFSRKATVHVALSEDDSDFVYVYFEVFQRLNHKFLLIIRELVRLDLVSDSSYARGYAHGFLLFKGPHSINKQ